MASLSANWYESGNFWQFVLGAIITISVGGLAAWAAIRAANPKRRLYCFMPTNQPLLKNADSVGDGLVVSYGGEPLEAPHLVQLRLVSAGSRDITAQQFHDGDPFILDVQATVVAILSVETQPSTRPNPAFEVHGAVLKMRPTLLVKGQEVSISLLVNGEPKMKLQESLTDVDVSDRPQKRSAIKGPLAAVGWSVVAVAAVTVFLVLVRFANMAMNAILEWIGAFG